MSLSIHSLYERFRDSLQLHWPDVQDIPPRHFERSSRTAPDAALIGFLNLIHPNRIQIIGRTEMDYLCGLGTGARGELLHKLFDPSLLAIIVSRGLTPPDELVNMAREQQIPLLSSPLPSKVILRSLHHFLSTELAEHLTLHGVFLDVHAHGVLLTGRSGIGKSELALELITRGHQLVADDAPDFFRITPIRLLGRCPELLQDLLEVRGLGVLNIRRLFGINAVKPEKSLSLIIDLVPTEEFAFTPEQRLRGLHNQRNILGVDIAHITLPVAPGRNLAVLVETAVLNHNLRSGGHDAAEMFIQRQRQRIEEQDG